MWLRHALRLLLAISIFSACSPHDRQAVDKLNISSYAYHYRSLDSTEYYAQQAYRLSESYADGRAEALNNLAFVRIIQMQYQEALRLLDTIPEVTDNQVELLVSYVQQMRLCQRMSRNRAFYDYREQAMRALQRIDLERDQLSDHLQQRLLYAESEMAIVTSTYYYYVGLDRQSAEALNAVPRYVEADTAQYLNCLYNIGAGGILTAGSAQDIAQQEFDHLMRCFLVARQYGYSFFAANSMEALAEHLVSPSMRRQLIDENLPAMKYINPEGIAEDLLPVWLASNALDTFREYGDTYQIAGAYRTLATCYHAEGDDESALFNLEQALEDSLIFQAPDLVAGIREQLSVAYAAMNDKPMSDYNRNVYLDLQEQSRQDRSLEARAGQLDYSVGQLNKLLVAVALSVLLLVLLLIAFSYWHWRQQKNEKPQDASAEEEELLEQLALHRLHIEQHERKAAEQRAKVALVTSITPFIDRVLHEAKALGTDDGSEQQERVRYIAELTDKIIEQNDVLTHWIQLRKGQLSLHIESFPLQPLFDMIARSTMSFSMKGVSLNVLPTDATVKADRVLTLFMLNTLADNARKFTGQGGQVTVSAEQTSDYVEISVADTGEGMDEEQLAALMSVERMVLRDGTADESPNTQTSHGFGLLNCRGIIDKYRKISQIFSVCLLDAQSQKGRGSRFFFRLPRGVVRLVLPLFLLLSQAIAAQTPTDQLLTRAKDYADAAYFSNIDGVYEQTLLYADSCRAALNGYYRAIVGEQAADTLLAFDDTSRTAPEIAWLRDSIHLNYDIILDIRNESSIAALALHQWDVYNYNNRIYTQLFKELSADNTLDDYCRKMQKSQANKSIAIALLAIVLMAILLAVALQMMRSLGRQAMRQRERQNHIEMMHDELRRAMMEEDKLYVSNAVLDNCLSSLKHETMYFPSRIRQLLLRGELEALPQVAGYYRELYGVLSGQLLRQTDEHRLHLVPLDHELLGDKTLIGMLFDTLRRQSGQSSLAAEYHSFDQHFVEVHIPMPQLRLTAAEAATLFEPSADHLPYMICRQIVRDHGEAINRTDFGIRAEVKDQHTVIIVKLPRQICKTSK
ncbi:MAG: DUF5112 domain-containing protein [Prevotella sp.]|nr:DUF5112 domain-containing protein [Prevotella sp.]